MKRLIIFSFIIRVSVAVNNQTALPIVLWHGIGDTCCLPISTGLLRMFLYNNIPDVYIRSLEFGADSRQDLENSFVLNPNRQVDYACWALRDDKFLKNGFNAIGLGQGGLFLRAVIQRCGHTLPPVRNLITLGSPHQGVNSLTRCISVSYQTCTSIKELLQFAAYHSATQLAVVPATYWHDPLHENEYKNKSIFLADINNEVAINELYRYNLKRLEHFVMVKFEYDSVVQPRESAWFGFYAPGKWNELETLQQSGVYLEDRLGLKEMDRDGKLVFLTQKADHLQLETSWLHEHIIQYLTGYEHKTNQTSTLSIDF